MENDLDIKLYNEYLNGEKEAFELLYNKYKDKITYFIYNIVKDYQKSEDIAQDVFIYVLQNKLKEGYSFKHYIYMVAKSRAINYINTENRRNEISSEYLLQEEQQTYQDVSDIITKNETRKELMEAINMLDIKYRNAIYLNKVENLSYKEIADILEETVSNVKNLIHRGKNQLRLILLKKGFDEMNKVSKVVIMVLCIGVLLAGGVYAATRIIKASTGKATMTPTYTSKLSTMDSNKVWVGTFNLVWNDFMNDVIKGPIEFNDGPSELADELNKQTFTISQLSENSIFKIHDETSLELKNKIEKGIKQKFNENSKIIDKINWNDPTGYVLYAMLKKEFKFLEPFSTAMGSMEFNGAKERVKCFGVDGSTKPEAGKNVEILFYNSQKDFAIRLKTKEGEDVILYKTTGEGKSFEENYQELKEKQNKYNGNTTFGKTDKLRIPFIKVNDEINYDELCGRGIKGTGWFIRQALQTIDFELNNVGGSVKSEAVIEATKSAIDDDKKMIFDSDFILYLKEESKEQPYFALKVDDVSVLVKDDTAISPVEDEDDENEIVENSTTSNTTTENILNNNTERRNTVNNTASNNSTRRNNTNNANVNNNNNNDNEQPINTETSSKLNTEENSNELVTFEGTIKNIINEECVSIVPNKENPRITSKAVLIEYQKNKGYEIGKKVKVTFKGEITKSYPQNIDLVSIEILE